MSGSRDLILERIREALSRNGPGIRVGFAGIPAPKAVEEGPSAGEGEEGEERSVVRTIIPREYKKKGTQYRSEVSKLFLERVSDYHAQVVRVVKEDLPTALLDLLRKRGVERLVVPQALPSDWLTAVRESPITLLPDPYMGPGGPRTLNGAALPLRRAQLEASDGVLTGCALAIAETGTIVLDAGPSQGRRVLTLLPDYHLCVVEADQIVETVPEAIRALGATLRERRAPITFVSGPSATSDIELSRVEGVHGPRILDVVLVPATA